MTYSVVARCPDTGRFGVAVQTHYFAVGAVVPWVAAGVGAVATQSWTNVTFGPRGLAQMAEGMSASEIRKRLVAEDDQAEVRQVAFLDSSGRVAQHTGGRCVAYANHVAVEGAAFQANLMRNPGVPEAMAERWSATVGQPLEQRLLECLRAAEAQGGDIRGQQSAAMKVAKAERMEWGDGVSVDIRVDDHVSPLEELERLLTMRIAYEMSDKAEEHLLRGSADAASALYARARDVAPNAKEIAFWEGVALANAGMLEAARNSMHVAFAENDAWRECVPRAAAAGFLKVDDAAVAFLLS